MNTSQLPYTQQMQTHEANVRGTYISIACDYEQLMDDLIVLCELEKIFPAGFDEKSDGEIIQEINGYKTKWVTSVEMGKKFRKCKDGLVKYSQTYFDDFSPHFIVISDLIQDRNLMAHGYSNYDVQQESGKIFILFENVQQGKKEEKLIEVRPYIAKLEKYRKGIMELMGLTLTLRMEIFGKRHIA